MYLLSRFWCPEATLQDKFELDGVNYPLWAEQGLILPTPGETTRTDYIRKEINVLGELYDIAEIRADRSHASELMQNLVDDGFKVIQHGQGRYAMNSPLRGTKELILEHRLKHSGDPVLTWNVLNAVVNKDAQERMMFIKDKAEDRIDGAVAMAMAVGALLIAPEETDIDYEVIAI